MDNQSEVFPIVDEEGKVTGSATRGECHSGSKLLHPVVHLHVFNSKGDIYLQRRPEWKDIQPGKWDTAVGGHIGYGETPEEALKREVREELGITDFRPTFIGKYVFESKRERELVYVHRTTYDGEICPSTEELDGGRFWSMQEIREAMGKAAIERGQNQDCLDSAKREQARLKVKGVLTPNFESEFKRYFYKEMGITTKQITAANVDEQIKHLYQTAFPEDEQIPWNDLVRLIGEMHLDFTAYYEGEHFIGFTIVFPYEPVNWFWYFAVLPELRGQGRGQEILTMLIEKYKGKTCVLDMESPRQECDNKAQRMRRYAFYLRNGFRDTNLYRKFDVVEMTIMMMGEGTFTMKDWDGIVSELRKFWTWD